MRARKIRVFPRPYPRHTAAGVNGSLLFQYTIKHTRNIASYPKDTARDPVAVRPSKRRFRRKRECVCVWRRGERHTREEMMTSVTQRLALLSSKIICARNPGAQNICIRSPGTQSRVTARGRGFRTFFDFYLFIFFFSFVSSPHTFMSTYSLSLYLSPSLSFYI